MENQAMNNDEIEIDLMEVLYSLKRKLWLVLARSTSILWTKKVERLC